jgi:hypothetical protein
MSAVHLSVVGNGDRGFNVRLRWRDAELNQRDGSVLNLRGATGAVRSLLLEYSTIGDHFGIVNRATECRHDADVAQVHVAVALHHAGHSIDSDGREKLGV